MTEPHLKLRVCSDDRGCDLRLVGVRTLPDFAEDVGALVNASASAEIVRVALLPPLLAGVSIVGAFRVMVDAWLAVDPKRRPTVECMVASQAVVDALTPLLPGGDDVDISFRIGAARLSVVVGEITAIGADAIVNASNTSLRLGGGVSAAIRQACGPGLAAEMAVMARRRPLGDGDAVVTSSHGLKAARFIIHAASASGGDEAVGRSLRNVLALSVQHKFESVALPALGTGTGGMAMTRFAELLAVALREYAGTCELVGTVAQYPKLLRLVLFQRSDRAVVTNVLTAMLAPGSSE